MIGFIKEFKNTLDEHSKIQKELVKEIRLLRVKNEDFITILTSYLAFDKQMKMEEEKRRREFLPTSYDEKY